MAEYIKRKDALAKCGWYNTVNDKSICAVRKDELAAIPAADVAPVVHGRWKRYGRNLGECSNCGEIVATRHNYCPNCGARMDGEG